MSDEDFDIESLAVYLHVGAAQVLKLAERGKLPGRRVGGTWRFSRAEIHHWFERTLGVSDEHDLVHYEGVLESSERSRGVEPESVLLTRFLPMEAIAVPLLAKTRASVIRSMVELAGASGRLWDVPRMVEAVSAREEMHSTALEIGVALLHPRRPMVSILSEPTVALGITATPVVFAASGGFVTDVFFLICSTDDQGHLRTLARISRLIGQEGFLAELRGAASPAEAREVIEKRELLLS
jgi:PTS system nitrogen regulatory IIA component